MRPPLAVKVLHLIRHEEYAAVTAPVVVQLGMVVKPLGPEEARLAHDGAYGTAITLDDLDRARGVADAAIAVAGFRPTHVECRVRPRQASFWER